MVVRLGLASALRVSHTFAATEADPSDRWFRLHDQQLGRRPTDGSRVHRLRVEIREGDRDPSAEPRCKQPSDVWVMNADGSGQVILTQNPADDTAPAWQRRTLSLQPVYATTTRYRLARLGS